MPTLNPQVTDYLTLLSSKLFTAGQVNDPEFALAVLRNAQEIIPECINLLSYEKEYGIRIVNEERVKDEH